MLFSLFCACCNRDGMVEELRDMSGCRKGMPLKFAVSQSYASCWLGCLLLLVEIWSRVKQLQVVFAGVFRRLPAAKLL